jgi:hypothetical protein
MKCITIPYGKSNLCAIINAFPDFDHTPISALIEEPPTRSNSSTIRIGGSGSFQETGSKTIISNSFLILSKILPSSGCESANITRPARFDLPTQSTPRDHVTDRSASPPG